MRLLPTPLVLSATVWFSADAGTEDWQTEFDELDKDRNVHIDVNEATHGGYTAQQLKYYDKNKDGKLDVGEAVPFIRERFLYPKADWTGPDPKGHMQWLGSHADPEPPPDEFSSPAEYPHPREFWQKYINGHKPAVFRRAMSRASSFWSESYIKEHYGWVDVKLEPKNESRQDPVAYKDIEKSHYLGKKNKKKSALTSHRTNIKGILDNPAANIYAVSILPHAMAQDIDIPSSLLCGSRKEQYDVKAETRRQHQYPHPTGRNYTTMFLEANLWLAKGFTRSQLHYDKENILLCCVECVKDFILIDTRKYGSKVPWARGDKYNAENDLKNSWTDWVHLDPEKVDLRIYSFLQEVGYMRVRLNAGDCLFMPYSMMHQVTTHKDEAPTKPDIFQAAVSFMFDPTEVYDEEACKAYDVVRSKSQDKQLSVVPFIAFDLIWYYDGTGVIPQGYPLPYDQRTLLAQRLAKEEKKLLSAKTGKKAFTHKWHRSAMRKINPEAAALHDLKEVDAFTDELNSFAKNQTRGLTSKEILGDTKWEQIPIETWLKYSARIDGMLSCDDGHYYSPRKPEVWKEMEDAWLNIEKGLPAVTPKKTEL